MTLESKIAEYVALREKLEEIEHRKKELSQEILALMPKEETSVSVPGFRVKRASVLSIKTPIEQAKELGAVILKEVVDRSTIKRLYFSGQEIPGVTQVNYIQVYSEN